MNEQERAGEVTSNPLEFKKEQDECLQWSFRTKVMRGAGSHAERIVMGRSGYSDDFGDDGEYPLALYRQAVRSAITGQRGQGLLRRLRDALDAMPTKRLITNAIKDESGDVCAFGALDPSAPSTPHDEDYWDDGSNAEELANHFGIARALAAEIVFQNDEALSWRCQDETPEQRWKRMRAWVEQQIVQPRNDEASGSAG
jgi:hypothetical protein